MKCNFTKKEVLEQRGVVELYSEHNNCSTSNSSCPGQGSNPCTNVSACDEVHNMSKCS